MASPSIQPLSQRFNKMPRRLLVASLAAGVLGVVGLPASLVPKHLPLATRAAIAQNDVTTEEVTQYARAVLEMDEYRTEAYTKIKDILLSVNMDISEIDVSCSSRDISKVPRSVRRNVEEILVGYCNQAQEIVEANQLTSRRFNEITNAHRQNEGLSERIQQELIRLQQPQ